MNTIALLNSIHEHLAAFDLPDLWSVTVHSLATYGRDPILVQLSADVLPVAASTLLGWADTLTDVGAETWRVPDGASVHLHVRGLLADGVRVTVYAGMGHDARFCLEPDEKRPVSLAVLREWATLDQGMAA